MKSSDYLMEVVATARVSGSAYEVCASVVAHFEEKTRELVICRDTFARRMDSRGAEPYARPDWLPRPEIVRHLCEASDSARVAEQDFAVWTRQVRSGVEAIQKSARQARAEELWPGTGWDWVSAGRESLQVSEAVRLVPC